MTDKKLFGALRATTLAALCAGGFVLATAGCSAESEGGPEAGGETPADVGGEKSCSGDMGGEKSCGDSMGADKADGEKSYGDQMDGEKSCGDSMGGDKAGDKADGEKSCGEKSCG